MKHTFMDKNHYYSLYASAHNNAVDLLSEAKLLFGGKHYARAYFLALTALEEIAKSQMAADVWTGFTNEGHLKSKFTKHGGKLDSVEWATLDAAEFCRDVKITPPCVKKRMAALYTDVENGMVVSPSEQVSGEDAEAMIETVEVALRQIFISEEVNGNQIGTKGFMK